MKKSNMKIEIEELLGVNHPLFGEYYAKRTITSEMYKEKDDLDYVGSHPQVGVKCMFEHGSKKISCTIDAASIIVYDDVLYDTASFIDGTHVYDIEINYKDSELNEIEDVFVKVRDISEIDSDDDDCVIEIENVTFASYNG